ncbi:zinc finger transcriptional activator [Exophiala sideris]|uniref:Zinc finger transcriptional activator n=1 Tax=Exophiala sideris TaxID=1016849 RepID=A0ABR0IYX4_9EURO|nr:zinc finger transcriptional activator [Exophiala sideris]KAK5052329.1 zinc finger transcriptional activator [Exophiala sideris]KAK5177356.1 zinc finger transcriptional activator [Eurotiomycetes sp. CCFEE 6388]
MRSLQREEDSLRARRFGELSQKRKLRSTSEDVAEPIIYNGSANSTHGSQRWPDVRPPYHSTSSARVEVYPIQAQGKESLDYWNACGASEHASKPSEDLDAATDLPEQPLQAWAGVDSSVSEDNAQETRDRTSTRDRLLATNILNPLDALDLLTFAATEEHLHDQHTTSRIHQDGTNQSSNTVDGHHVTPKSAPAVSPSWKEFFLVKRGIVHAHEVTEYLDFYFAQLWPLLPVIPSHYNNKEHYLSLALEEPVLVIALTTLASRYHHLSGFNGAIRSERIHWRAWRWVQIYFQSAMWGASCMRKPGSIAALLLFIEWHCKALNSPEDFLGDVEDLDNNTGSRAIASPDFSISGTQMLSTKQHSNITTLMEKLNIVAPAYRSNKMSRILLSTAIALAEETCCFVEDHASLGTSTLSSPTRVRPNKAWNNILHVFIYLADENIALRVGLEPLLSHSRQNNIRDCLARTPLEEDLWESVIELTEHMGNGRELLRDWRQCASGNRTDDVVGPLQRIKRGLERWKRQHDLASTNEAMNAAISMLDLVVDVLAPSNVFKFVGVRYWLYTVCACLCALKITVAKEGTLDESHPNIRLIRAAVAAMKRNSPDDIHMSQRFSTFVEIVVTAAVRSSASVASSQHPTARVGQSQNNGASSSDDMGLSAPTPFQDFSMMNFEDWITDEFLAEYAEHTGFESYMATPI